MHLNHHHVTVISALVVGRWVERNLDDGWVLSSRLGAWTIFGLITYTVAPDRRVCTHQVGRATQNP